MSERYKYQEQLKKGDWDTGSPEYQVGRLSDKMERLRKHLLSNKKDNISRKGLMMMAWRRRRLIEYLKRVDSDSYDKVLEVLSISR